MNRLSLAVVGTAALFAAMAVEGCGREGGEGDEVASSASESTSGSAPPAEESSEAETPDDMTDEEDAWWCVAHEVPERLCGT